jgi:hypothetical protein
LQVQSVTLVGSQYAANDILAICVANGIFHEIGVGKPVVQTTQRDKAVAATAIDRNIDSTCC